MQISNTQTDGLFVSLREPEQVVRLSLPAEKKVKPSELKDKNQVEGERKTEAAFSTSKSFKMYLHSTFNSLNALGLAIRWFCVLMENQTLVGKGLRYQK